MSMIDSLTGHHATNTAVKTGAWMTRLLWIFSLVLISSCDRNEDARTKLEFNARYSMLGLPISTGYEGPTRSDLVPDSRIDEASGLVRSVSFSGSYWTHNDSGDAPRIFLLTQNGSTLATYTVHGAEHRDWEDIAIGRGPLSGKNYLYIADTGDNRSIYPTSRIYRIPEPESLGNITSTAEIIEFQFPNGPLDAETLLSDPLTGDLYILSKRLSPTRVFRLRYPHSTTQITTAEYIGNLPFIGATGGDISPDGRQILIKTLDTVFMWTRSADETISKAFSRVPQRLPYQQEAQGEAIGWSNDAQHYVTLSERSQDPIFLNRYSRTASQ
jgi:hypothetical protein